jgi:hypothetical protein
MAPGVPSTTTGRGTTAREVAGAAGRVVAVVLRLAGVALLGASAVLGWQAWWSRFSVCFGADVPPVPDLPANQAHLWCVYLQDHKYDYFVPEHPWVPIADAAQREGLSLIVLGVGVALISLSLAGRWFVWPLSVAGGAALAVMWVGMGVPVWRMGLTGEPAGFDDWRAASSLGILTLLATAGLAVLAWFHGGRHGHLAALFWAALTVAHLEFFFTMILWASHDTSPL